jgi:mono/diheme cytochrome c family protein
MPLLAMNWTRTHSGSIYKLEAQAVNSKIRKGTNTTFLRVSMALALMILFQTSSAQNPIDVEAGQTLFQTYCFACHGIGEAQRVGPDLAGVHDRRSQEWLQSFVSSPSTLIENGDADSVALVERFNGMVMPDSTISDQQIGQVLSYIQSRSAELGAESSTPETAASSTAENSTVAASPELPSEEEMEAGGNLFQGVQRFENSGPACNACHDVRSDAITGGGALAAELTSVYSRMGSAGLAAIISQAPFPAMQVAYGQNPLTENEVGSLVAFLQSAESLSETQQQRNYGFRLFLSGAFGAAFLFVLFPFLWRNRKVGSVNQAIYDRQNN